MERLKAMWTDEKAQGKNLTAAIAQLVGEGASDELARSSPLSADFIIRRPASPRNSMAPARKKHGINYRAHKEKCLGHRHEPD